MSRKQRSNLRSINDGKQDDEKDNGRNTAELKEETNKPEHALKLELLIFIEMDISIHLQIFIYRCSNKHLFGQMIAMEPNFEVSCKALNEHVFLEIYQLYLNFGLELVALPLSPSVSLSLSYMSIIPTCCHILFFFLYICTNIYRFLSFSFSYLHINKIFVSVSLSTSYYVIILVFLVFMPTFLNFISYLLLVLFCNQFLSSVCFFHSNFLSDFIFSIFGL